MNKHHILTSILTLSFVGLKAGDEQNSVTQLLSAMNRVISYYKFENIEKGSGSLHGHELRVFVDIKASIPKKFKELSAPEQQSVRQQLTAIMVLEQNKINAQTIQGFGVRWGILEQPVQDIRVRSRKPCCARICGNWLSKKTQ